MLNTDRSRCANDHGRYRCALPQGFNLIEMMVVVAVIAILLALAAPSFGKMVQNTKIRTVAEVLQNGMRLAKNEAVRRSRRVTFTLTNAPGFAPPPSTAGKSWSIQTEPLIEGEVGEFIQSASLGGASASVSVTASTATLTFNSVGRLTTDGTNTFDIVNGSGDRPLRVVVSQSGQIRMCDPAQTLATSTTGC